MSDSPPEAATGDHVDSIQAQWRRARPDLDPSPQGVIGRISRLADYLQGELNPVFARHGLGEGEFDVLAALRRSEVERMSCSQIGRRTMVTSGAVTKRLDRLERAGLVARFRSESDGRGRDAALTERGREVIDAAFTEHMANEHRLLADMPAADRAELERILRAWLLRV